MLDTEHIGDTHPRRFTHWEIHPVTALEVCTLTKAKCDDGEGWEDLEQWDLSQVLLAQIMFLAKGQALIGR